MLEVIQRERVSEWWCGSVVWWFRFFCLVGSKRKERSEKIEGQRERDLCGGVCEGGWVVRQRDTASRQFVCEDREKGPRTFLT